MQSKSESKSKSCSPQMLLAAIVEVGAAFKTLEPEGPGRNDVERLLR